MKKYIIELPETTMCLSTDDGFISRNNDLITAQFDINNLTPVEDDNSVEVGDIVNFSIARIHSSIDDVSRELHRLNETIKRNHEQTMWQAYPPRRLNDIKER